MEFNLNDKITIDEALAFAEWFAVSTSTDVVLHEVFKDDTWATKAFWKDAMPKRYAQYLERLKETDLQAYNRE